MNRLGLILAASWLAMSTVARAGELDAEYGAKTKVTITTPTVSKASSELDAESPTQTCCFKRRFCCYRYGYGGYGYGGYGGLGYGGYGGYGGGFSGSGGGFGGGGFGGGFGGGGYGGGFGGGGYGGYGGGFGGGYGGMY
jgi:hypothetical protein